MKRTMKNMAHIWSNKQRQRKERALAIHFNLKDDDNTQQSTHIVLLFLTSVHQPDPTQKEDEEYEEGDRINRPITVTRPTVSFQLHRSTSQIPQIN